MKKIQLKRLMILPVLPNEEPTPLNYWVEYRNVLLAPKDPQAGTSHEEMATVVPILTKFAKAERENVIFLEDAEHAEICERLKNTKYRINAIEVFTMVQDFLNSGEPTDNLE